MTTKSRVRVERLYEDVAPADGQRVLVDGLWPRGIRKDDPRVGIWRKEVAPSRELRDWYHHDPERFDEFVARYEAELADNPALQELRTLARRGVITLVTGTREVAGSSCGSVGEVAGARLKPRTEARELTAGSTEQTRS
nr:DUF488 family protein [Mycobacterium tilburgii]